MQTAKSGSHTIWDCKYHIVWVTKYRYPVLVGDVGLRARELIREIARSHEMMIHAGAINRDHVHLLISIPPYLSVSRSVQFLKGKSSHKLLAEFQVLRKRYWGQHLWSRDIGLLRAGMSPMTCGKSISRTRSRRSQTTISKWSDLSTPSHRL